MKDSEKLRMKLRNTWSRKLSLWWQHYNDQYLLGALREPLLRLGRSQQQLGRWDGSIRTITISEFHIERDPWLWVMDTLRHEMAHQYVEEVLRVRNEDPHGPAFSEACKRLRCLPKADADCNQMTGHALDKEEKLARKLRKVLSLTGSPNEHEAEVALRKARFLMLKYNVDLVEMDAERQFETRYLGQIKGRHMSYELWLASILNEFFFVEVIWAHSYDALPDRMGTVLQVFGTPSNLDMAEYVYDYLTQTIHGLWESYRANRGMSSNRERQRYFAGVLEGFYRKLQHQEKRVANTYALVWHGDRRLRTYYRYLNPTVRTSRWYGVSSTRTYRDGLTEGSRVTIRQPISQPNSGIAGYLEN